MNFFLKIIEIFRVIGTFLEILDDFLGGGEGFFLSHKVVELGAELGFELS
jgi:hypothetical protein